MSSGLERDRPMPTTEPRPAPSTRDAHVPVVDSRSLFSGHVELRIEHHGVVYRLKQTALGKLILTK